MNGDIVVPFKSLFTTYFYRLLIRFYFWHIIISVKAHFVHFRVALSHDRQGRIRGLTAVRCFTLGGEDDEAETLIVSAVQRNVKRFVVKSAGHWKPR